MKKVAILIVGSLIATPPLAAQDPHHAPPAADSVAPGATMDMMARMMTMMAQMHSMMGDQMMPGMMGDQMMPGMMGDQMMPGMMGSQMMPGMMDLDCPCLALRIRDALALSEEQIQRIGQIDERSRQEASEHTRMATEAQRAALSALHAESPHLQDYEARLREAAGHLVDARLALARGSAQAREVLTSEQRAKLRSAMDSVQELMQMPR